MCGKDRASTALGAATCPKPPSCTVPGSSAKEGHRAKLVGIVLRKIRGLSSEPLVSDEYGEATRNVRTAPQHPLRGGPKPVFSDTVVNLLHQHLLSVSGVRCAGFESGVAHRGGDQHTVVLPGLHQGPHMGRNHNGAPSRKIKTTVVWQCKNSKTAVPDS